MSTLKVLSAAIALFAALSVQSGIAQEASPQSRGSQPDSWQLASSPVPLAGFSSSVSDSDETAKAGVVPVAQPVEPKNAEISFRPFSRIAIGAKLGSLGWGGQIATPLTRWMTLRGGADFFNFGYGLTSDGTNYYASLHMKSGTVQADVYPFRRVSFHVSPGVLIFKSNAAANMNVPGGSTFTENDVDYTSDPNDPVNGSGTVVFQRSVMPALTIGFGNMITRRENKHWSMPFEIGAAYTGHYALGINLSGSACQQGVCQSVNQPSIQQNVVQQQNKINEELKHFQIYPILTTGVAYRF
jgi:hypothetical protein